MRTPLPILFTWTSEVMEPRGTRARAECAREYAPGKTYWLSEEHGRSMASHRHEFAWLHDAWLNLPEDLADQFPSPEHLRKRALLDAGYYTEQIIDAGSAAAALRVAAGVRMRPGEEFSMVFARGAFVIIRSPMSQSLRAMGPADFQKSKTAILEIVSGMIGVSPAQLAAAGQETRDDSEYGERQSS